MVIKSKNRVGRHSHGTHPTYITAVGFKQECGDLHGLSDNENVGLERRES